MVKVLKSNWNRFLVTKKNKIYFASDLHLGVPGKKSSLEREKLFVQWLEEARKDAFAIYLLGDIFDFWFEYKRVAPRGYTRLLGKLSEITDSGIPVHFFTGNHDIWVFDYLPEETGVILHRDPISIEYGNKKLYMAHGDGLGPGDKGYKFLKKMFTSRFLQWCYSRLHPNFAIWFAGKMSYKSRLAGGPEEFMGEEKEWLALHAREVNMTDPHNYFIFGHRHLPVDIELKDKARLIYLGDWMENFTYGVFDGDIFELKSYPL